MTTLHSLFEFEIDGTTYRITDAGADQAWGGHTWSVADIKSYDEPQGAQEFAPKQITVTIQETAAAQAWRDRLWPTFGIGHPFVAYEIEDLGPPVVATRKLFGKTAGFVPDLDGRGLRTVILCRSRYASKGEMREVVIDDLSHRSMPGSETDNIFAHVAKQRSTLWA